MIDEAKREFKITNDSIGFKYLLKELKMFSEHSQIILEATSVYSRRLIRFLDDYQYDYVVLNPLKAKKEMNQGLRHNKTDRNAAYHLALVQDQNHHRSNVKQDNIYSKMQSLSRSYEDLTLDIVTAKNRLHRILQLTSSELETIMVHPKNENYWKLVQMFPHCQDVREVEEKDIVKRVSDFKGYGVKRAQKAAARLKELANVACPAVNQYGPERDDIIYYAKRLIQLDKDRNLRLEEMLKLAKRLPNRDLELLMSSIPGIAQVTVARILAELGDFRRFDDPTIRSMLLLGSIQEDTSLTKWIQT